MKWTFYKQHDAMDCGPTCLRMIAKFYGKNYSLKTLRALTEVNRSGTSMLGISIAGEKLDLKCTGIIGSIKSLQGLQQPCILHWRQNHFVVLIHKRKRKFIIADPARGIIEYTFEELRENWIGNAENGKGIYLSISPTELFDQNEGEKVSDGNWSLILRQLKIYKKLITQLLCGLISSSLLLLIARFLTQAIVDVGINSKSYNIMVLILLAQGTLIISRLVIETLRSWILLHISARINISILTAFLIKLMKLPVSFFDTKQTSDIMQRMADQRNIESFLTGPGLIAIFSLSNLIVFSVILVYYNFLIFVLFF
ncbi:MAG: cysteine peptidase family C39 domain-containing protein [Mucilaginibacter sp.]